QRLAQNFDQPPTVRSTASYPTVGLALKVNKGSPPGREGTGPGWRLIAMRAVNRSAVAGAATEGVCPSRPAAGPSIKAPFQKGALTSPRSAFRLVMAPA